MITRLVPSIKYSHLLYFFTFIAGWPCVFYLMGWLPHYTINYIALFLITSIIVISKNRLRVPTPIRSLIITQITIWGIFSLIHGFDTSYFTRIFLLLITYFLLEIQMRSKDVEFIKTYNYWITFQVIAGTIGAILVLNNILQPIFEFKEMDMRTGYFFGLFTTNAYYPGFIRNAGFFDEPGALAFWGMYALIMNKLFINNKKIELLLIFGLISTLSMAYFIQIVFYLYFFYKQQRKKLFFPILVFILSLKAIASINEDLDKAIFGRFEYNKETGSFEGDNRSEIMKVCKKLFIESPIIGQGANNLIRISEKEKIFVGANAYFTLACDGIIGQIVILSPFFMLFQLRRKNNYYTGAFWLLILGFLQRPYDSTQLLYPLISFTLVLHAYLNKQFPQVSSPIESRNNCKYKN